MPGGVREIEGEELLQLKLHGEHGALRSGDERMDGGEDGRRARHAEHDRTGTGQDPAHFSERAAQRIGVGRVAGNLMRGAHDQAAALPFQDDRPEPGEPELNANADCHVIRIA